MLADSHCHLNYPGLVEHQQAVLERARARGVTAMLNIATRESEWDAVLATAEREPDVWATVGIHPNEADAHPHVDTAKLVARAAHPRVVGIGESGLDYHYDHSGPEQQQASFRAHVAACRETGLPLIVHTRDAEADTIAILRDEMDKAPIRRHPLFHRQPRFCRQGTGTRPLYLHLGIVTFKNAKEIQDTARIIPADRLLIETDAPFLAPVPHRGKPGEPGFVADTLAFLAQLRGEAPEALAERTATNFHTLFGKTRG